MISKHKIKRSLQLMALKTIKALNATQKPNEKHSDYEKECISVCKALIHKEDCSLLMSPISGKRYIKSSDDQLFIIIDIDQHQVTIVNHQYSYTINIWGKALERIVQLFDIEVEKRREMMEMEIRSNVKHSLSNIFKTLSNESK